MADLLYSFDLLSRYLIIRGQDTTLTASWSRAGSTVTPTPGTARVYRSSSEEVIGATAFTVDADDIASVTVPAAATADLPLETGWTVEWSDVEFPDGSTRTFVAEAVLVRHAMAPPASQADLYRRFARLDPTHRSPMVSSDFDLQDKLDEAWREIEDRLYRNGRRPELVMSPAQFRRPHRELALALIFEDLRTMNWEAYDTVASQLRQGFEAMWSQLVFSYDADEDGLPDEGATNHKAGATTPMWLTGRGGGY
jgi:hypothetical protein